MSPRLKATTLYVTHDQVEAMTMGDRICLMKDGRIQQVAEAEAERAALERRVWRWALLGMLCLVVLGAVFALVSRWHWL